MLWGHLIAAFQYLQGTYKRAREGRFTGAVSNRTRRNSCNLKEGMLKLDIRKKIFTVKVMRQCCQRGYGLFISGNVQDQSGWAS